MNTAADDLARLRAELGDDADLLRHTPLAKIATQPLDDADGISFAIYFGYAKCHTGDIRREVWVHLYPAANSGRHPEVQFHSYVVPGHDYARYGGDTIGKIMSAYAAPFNLPGIRYSRGKLVALAKYYFLEQLVKQQTEDDQEKLQLVDVPISKSFREDLVAAAKDFESEARRQGKITDNQGSECEEAMPNLFEREELPQAADTEARRAVIPNEVRVDEVQSIGVSVL